MNNEGLPKSERKELYTRVLLRVALLIIVAVLCVVAVPRLVGMVLPFVFALLLAWALNPVIKKTVSVLKMPRKAITGVLLVIVFAAIIGILVWCVYTLVYEFMTLVSNWEVHWSNFADTISAIENKMTMGDARVSTTEMFIWETVDTVLDWLEDSLGETVELVVSVSGSMASGIAAASVYLVAFIMASFFITVDYPRLTWLANEKFGGLMKHLIGIKDNFLIIVGGYVKQQFILSTMAFAVMALGFAIIDQEYALLLALLIAIVDFVPFFGVGTVLLPWAVICFMTDRMGKGLSILAVYLAAKVVRIVAKSFFPKTKPGLTPVQLLLSIYAGYVMDGILGMIWCPILLVLFLNFCKTGVFKNTIRDIKAVWQDIRSQISRTGEG